MADTMPPAADTDQQARIPYRITESGLYYLSRDGAECYRLDWPFSPDMQRPERDVAIALMSYAIEKLRMADSHDPRMAD